MATQIVNTPDELPQRRFPEAMLTATRPGSLYEPPNVITLADLLYFLWVRKWTLLAALVAAAVLAYVGALLAPKEYTASITISPTSGSMDQGEGGGLRSLASQFSGLASLAGLSVGSDTRKQEFLAVLKSERVTQQFITENHLLPILYSKKWDPVQQRWKVRDARKIPTLWKANRLFDKKVREITTDAKTGIVTLSITWKDPALAAAWANGLVKMTNDYLRNEAIAESELHIAYLNEQAAKMNFVDARQAIYSLLQDEINREMVARGSDQYAFKVLDPAFQPEAPSWPQPLLWAFVAVFAVALSATFAAYVNLSRRQTTEAHRAPS